MSGPLGASQFMYNTGAANFYEYQIEQSLRMEAGSAMYLSRTLGTASDRDKVTIYRTPGATRQGYLVRQDTIDELENNGVQVILPREYYQIVENGTS